VNYVRITLKNRNIMTAGVNYAGSFQVEVGDPHHLQRLTLTTGRN
jgi:hypothetical protein